MSHCPRLKKTSWLCSPTWNKWGKHSPLGPGPQHVPAVSAMCLPNILFWVFCFFVFFFPLTLCLCSRHFGNPCTVSEALSHLHRRLRQWYCWSSFLNVFLYRMCGLPGKCLSFLLGTLIPVRQKTGISSGSQARNEGIGFLLVALRSVSFQNLIQHRQGERESPSISLYSEDEADEKSDFPACKCPSWTFVMLLVLFCSS